MTIAIGAFLNAIGILLGAFFGLASPKLPSLRTQVFFRSALGAFTVFFGLRLVWISLNGTFLACVKQFFLAALAVVLGAWLGKLLRLQKISNRFGRYAGNIIASAQKNPAVNAVDGLNACAILFCAAPLGLLGAVTDGLSGYFFPLAVKAAMDGFAMMSFVKMFRWPCALSAIPVFIFFSAISTAIQFYVAPLLSAVQVDSIQAAAGLIICAVALIIFEVRRVELNSYLPALIVAPLLAHWFV